jgi:hypothetical protein
VEELAGPVEILQNGTSRFGALDSGVYLLSSDLQKARIYFPDRDDPPLEIDLLAMSGGLGAGDLGDETHLAWITLEGNLYLYALETGCYHSLGGRYQSLAGAPEFTDELPESDPKLKDLETSTCLGVTQSEDWTLTFEEDGYRVEGSFSGLQSQPAREGEAYTTDQGEVSFLVEAGDKPTTPGDSFIFSTDEGIGGLYVGAAARALYLDSEQGLVWVADQAGGRILVVDPAVGEIEKIIE